MSVAEALKHGGIANRAQVNIRWIDAEELTPENLEEYLHDVDGILVPGGFGQRGTEGKILAKMCIRDRIYMVRVEAGDTILFGKCSKYRSRKRLYELEKQLGKQFMQISKSTLVNLSYLDSIEAGFNGTLLLKLKNGCKDYVSRKYLPEFKKYLGL